MYPTSKSEENEFVKLKIQLIQTLNAVKLQEGKINQSLYYSKNVDIKITDIKKKLDDITDEQKKINQKLEDIARAIKNG